MDWIEGMNQAIEYIEAHLLDDIDMDALARCVRCSTYEFSRLFSFAAGMPVSEYLRRTYVRRRRCLYHRRGTGG